MHLSATAIAALLMAAGVDTLVDAAPAPSDGHRTAPETAHTPRSLQGKGASGTARPAMAA